MNSKIFKQINEMRSAYYELIFAYKDPNRTFKEAKSVSPKENAALFEPKTPENLHKEKALQNKEPLKENTRRNIFADSWTKLAQKLSIEIEDFYN